MKKLNYLLAILITISVFFAGCRGDDGAQGPTGLSGPSLTGDIIGFVKLTDLYGNLVTDFSNTVVSIDSKPYSDTVDVYGKFILAGVPSGTYNISYSKPGFGLQKNVGYQFVGGGQTYTGITYLYQIPTFTVGNLSANTNNNSINIYGNFVGINPGSRNVRIFIGLDSAVSFDPLKYVYSTTDYSSSQNNFSLSVSENTLKTYGVGGGIPLYIVAYAESVSSNSYIDLITGRYVYTSINTTPSNKVAVISP
jgi:hypothetical protein